MTKTCNQIIYTTLALMIAFAFTTTAFAATLSESEAIEIAENAYEGNGKVTEVELEREDGVKVYEVEFTESNGSEVDVVLNAETGKVIEIESDEEEEYDDEWEDEDEDEREDEELEEAEQALLRTQADITPGEAVDAAEAFYVGNGVFNEVDLDNEKGTLRYEVEFVESDGAEVEVHVDATTGVVLGQEEDVEEDDDDERDQAIETLRQRLIDMIKQLLEIL